jgi:hypothetical protein
MSDTDKIKIFFLVLQVLGVLVSVFFVWKSTKILNHVKKNTEQAKTFRQETAAMLSEIEKLNKDTEALMQTMPYPAAQQYLAQRERDPKYRSIDDPWETKP